MNQSKKYIITRAGFAQMNKDYGTLKASVHAEGFDDMQVSDGHHTMDELYDHRIALFISLCRVLSYPDIDTWKVWRSKLHSDGTMFDGWFILGITNSGDLVDTKSGAEQITYHLPLSKWEETNFASTLDCAPEWDGHTPADVLERLKKL